MSGWTTLVQMPAATPASIALPPRRSISTPASAAAGWPAATTKRRPCTTGRRVVAPGSAPWDASSRIAAMLPLPAVYHSHDTRQRRSNDAVGIGAKFGLLVRLRWQAYGISTNFAPDVYSGHEANGRTRRRVSQSGRQ